MSDDNRVWVTIYYNGGRGRTRHLSKGFLSRLEHYLKFHPKGRRMDVIIVRN